MNEPSRTENTAVNLRELEDLIGYHFKNKAFLKEAITASSYSKEHPDSTDYQRLELLGDRVISLILTENLMAEESLDEGKMTFLKAELENNQRLAEYGEELGLRNYIRALEEREEISSKVIADVFEAICGAIYLDSEDLQGMRVVEQLLQRFNIFEQLKERISTMEDFLPVRNRFENKFRDIYHDNPDIKFAYQSQGAAHQKQWRIDACAIKDVQTGEYVDLHGVKSDQWFTSKKEAETDVIEKAYRYMEKNGWRLKRS
jgi:ribonuclease-3